MILLKKTVYITIFCGLLWGAPLRSFAQTPTDQASQNNQSIIQQYEQERLQSEFEENLEREKKALKNDLSVEKREQVQEGPCIDVQTIILSGNNLYTRETLNSLTEPYKGRCLYLSDINGLAEEITNFYIERGYITTRTYIPAQDLSDGSLELKIVEGTLEKINYQENGKPGKETHTEFAFPVTPGHELNLRDIEQGLDQMNRLQSHDAKMSLKPGQKSGATIIEVNNETTKPWHARTGVENTGTKSTGEWQGYIEFDYDDLLDINDLLSLSFKHDLERANRRQSRSISARYEIPYKYWNFYYALSYFDYTSEVSTALNDFKTEGFSRTHDIGLRRVLHRDQNSKTNISASLVAKDNENFLAGAKLSNSSQKLTIANLGFSHSCQIPNGFLYAGINYSRGLGWLGAQEDNNLSASAPKAEFDRITADISATKLWDVGFEQYNPRTDLRIRGQWSADTLFGSEQISAGGPYSVRGFKESSISGDTGVYAKLDISLPYSFGESIWLNDNIGQLRPYIGFDNGIIKSDSKNSFEGGTIRSWSLGLKNEGGKFDFEVAYSRPITAPSYIDKDSHEIFFKTSIKF